MARFLVRWEIDVEDVDTPLEAAQEAWKLRNNKGSTANVFTTMNKDMEDVHPFKFHQVDLSERGEKRIMNITKTDF